MVESDNLTMEQLIERNYTTTKEYFEDSYRVSKIVVINLLFQFESQSSVVDVIGAVEGITKEADEAIVILDKTIFHPQGGGQPNDEGHMQNTDGSVKFKVNNLVCKKDAIYHVGTYEPKGSSFAKDDKVDVKVNEELRRLAARFHSAGHLLDMAMNKAGRPDLKPSKGYHFTTGGAYVEYIGNVDEKERPALIADLNKYSKEIIQGTPEEMKVFKKVCSYEEAG